MLAARLSHRSVSDKYNPVIVVNGHEGEKIKGRCRPPFLCQRPSEVVQNPNQKHQIELQSTMSSLPTCEPQAECRPGWVRRMLIPFWRDGNFRKDNFLANDGDFVPRSEDLRTALVSSLGQSRSLDAIKALPQEAQTVIARESRRAQAHFELRPGLPALAKAPIGLSFVACFAFPIIIAFQEAQWSFALGSITSAPRSVELIFLYSRYPHCGLELLLTFFENRLWINIPPGIVFLLYKIKAVAAQKGEPWLLAVLSLFSAALLLFGIFIRPFLWNKKLKPMRKIQAGLTENQVTSLLSYSNALNEAAKPIVGMKEERGSGDPDWPEQKGASVPTAEIMENGVLHVRRTCQIMAIYAQHPDAHGPYTSSMKYKYYVVVVSAFILTVGLNYDQPMAIVDAIGKYIWTLIKIRGDVRDSYRSPSALGRRVSIIFIETIPSLILIGIPLRASGGTILDTWQARLGIGLGLGIVKTFLADHVLVLFFAIWRGLAWIWSKRDVFAVEYRLAASADRLCGWMHDAAIWLQLDKVYAFLRSLFAPLFSWVVKGFFRILG